MPLLGEETEFAQKWMALCEANLSDTGIREPILCYEYLGSHGGGGGESCFHLKCGTCGRLIHLHCEEISDMREHLRAEHGFYWNPLGTVFYGECAECRRTKPDLSEN